jgi:Repeat of unknown function (DUF5907)
MPLETGTYLPDLVTSNPVHTDGVNQADSHLRLIKSVLKNTFPNFTDVALASTQTELDAAVAFTTGRIISPVDGSTADPAFSFAAEGDTGFYRAAAGEIGVVSAGTQIGVFYPGGYDIGVNGLTSEGVSIFPLQSANIGALQVTTAALAANAVTYAKLQNAAGASVLLGAQTASAPFAEITLGTGLVMSGGVLSSNTAAQPPLDAVVNLQIGNDGVSPNTKLDVLADEACLLDSSGNSQRFFNVSVAIDFTLTGAGGVDVSTRQASKGYYIYLIGNPTTATVMALASLDTNTSPTLPSGYTAATRVAWYPTDSSSNLLRIKTVGERAVYLAASMPSVASGAATNAAVTLTGKVPARATIATFIVLATSGSVSVAPNTGYAAAPASTTGGSIQVDLVLEGSPIYNGSGSGDALYLRGWVMPL